MFRKTIIAALLATVAVAATQPAGAAIFPNGKFLNGGGWNGGGSNGVQPNGIYPNGIYPNGGWYNGTAGATQAATVVAIELPQPK